jgi:uncharacterized protein (TIGR02266 family)
LFPGKDLMMETTDTRRQHERVDVRIRTIYHDEIDAEGSDSLMSNLSLGGCFIKTSRPAGPGTRIKVQFKIPDSDHVVEAVAHVRWTQDSGPEEQRGMGLQFENIKQTDLLLLKQFIARKLETSVW